LCLERDRHQQIIDDIRSLGSRIKMIGDGDVSAVISSVLPNNNIDMYYGIGGAPEGVFSCRCSTMRRWFYGRKIIVQEWWWKSESYKSQYNWFLIKFYSLEELAQGDVMFSATGVTDGTMLPGVQNKLNLWEETHSIVMRYKNRNSTSYSW